MHHRLNAFSNEIQDSTLKSSYFESGSSFLNKDFMFFSFRNPEFLKKFSSRSITLFIHFFSRILRLWATYIPFLNICIIFAFGNTYSQNDNKNVFLGSFQPQGRLILNIDLYLK